MAALAAAGALVPIGSEIRFGRAARPLTDRWRSITVEPRGRTRLGISFRPLQAEAMGLDSDATLGTLLDHPFEVIRLGAYWNRIERPDGTLAPVALDAQIDAAERAGKQIILCVGAVKCFGYPEFFVPDHRLPVPLREGALVEPADHRPLLDGAAGIVTRLVERYRDRSAIIAWQVEHEAVDPLGIEHTWRLSSAFVRAEVHAVRAADPTRPIVMNGFLPTSTPVRLQQWWRTHDQGDSLAVAQDLADIVGVDFYPRHALVGVGGRTLYLDGSRKAWQQARRRRLLQWGASSGREVIVAEGQAEPWETVTTPPDPAGQVMSSCRPEHVIENYNQCMGWNRPSTYLFWGAEYWVLRERQGDASYLDAFARVLAES